MKITRGNDSIIFAGDIIFTGYMVKTPEM